MRIVCQLNVTELAYYTPYTVDEIQIYVFAKLTYVEISIV